MITMEEPHMAINSKDLTGRYQMWNSWIDVDSSVKREKIIKWVATVAKGAPGGKLKNLIINSHGSPSSIQIGEGFGPSNVKLFSAWAGLIDKLWLIACSVGRITSSADGNMFLYNIATNAKCHVVASTEKQVGRKRVYPYGKIDTFEGLLLSYTPGKGVTWSHRYSSSWQVNASPGGRISFNLPGVPPPWCAVELRGGKEEVLQTQLDTVIINTDENLVFLLWRAHMVVRNGPQDVLAIEIDTKPRVTETAAV